MAKSKSYNGHKNWNHWNVSLWINNDYGLYSLAKDCIASSDNRDEAAEKMLRSVSKKTPDARRIARPRSAPLWLECKINRQSEK